MNTQEEEEEGKVYRLTDYLIFFLPHPCLLLLFFSFTTTAADIID
jgi:hypothetical protein